MAEFDDDIESYLSGNLTPEEMHALERKALSDPFLADALEGASSIPPNDFASDVNAFRHQIISSKVRNRWVIPFRIAATVIFLFTATYLIYYFTSQQEAVTITQNVSKEAGPSLKSNLDSLTPKKNEKPKSGLLSLNQPASRARREKTGEGAVHLSEPAKPALALRDEKTESEQVVLADSIFVDSAQALVAVSAQGLEKVNAETNKTAKKEAEEEPKIKTKDVSKADATRSSYAAAGAPSIISRQKMINGKITSADDGTPIPGANVLIHGTNNGAVSDANGDFQVITPAPQDSLIVSSIGFATKEVTVPGNKSQVNISLDTDATQLSEVVVVGLARETNDNDNAPVHLAEPVVGKRAYKKYLESNLHYPQQALAQKIEGKVTVEFMVQATGALSDFTILRGLGYGCGEEVIRLIKEGPAWKPSAKAATNLKSTVRVGVKFKLPK